MLVNANFQAKYHILQPLEGEKTWQEAEGQCSEAGALIVVPNDHVEDRFVHNLALLEGGNLWLGIRENVRIEVN